jgi:hypothetical protein
MDWQKRGREAGCRRADIGDGEQDEVGQDAALRSIHALQLGPGVGQLLLQAVLDGEDPLGDFQPAGV